MPSLPDLQSFELRTERTKTLLPLQGSLSGWSDEHEHRVNEHSIIGKAGAIHQSNAQGPRRFTFLLLILGSDANDRYQVLESTLASDPFGRATHPRLGGFDYVYNTLKITEDLDGQINGLTAELKITETGLRDVVVVGASTAARAARSSSEDLLNSIGATISRITNADPPSLADLTAASPIKGVPASITAMVSLGAHIYSACNALVELTDDASTDQHTLAAQLVTVGLAVESFTSTAGTDVANYLLLGSARLVYGRALMAYQEAAAGRGVPVVPRRVPGRMSLARFCLSLYGGGAQALEAEILRLNRGAIPLPYALTPGVELLIPDPDKVRLDESASTGMASSQQRAF